jgi:hypothetical protein
VNIGKKYMRCFFGHKFGKIENDGFQYCQRCGMAANPNPCDGGHIWCDNEILNYHYAYGYKEGVKKKQVFQTCTTCGEKRAIWIE